ncbi:hypothetical protein V5799_033564 [Amblyomma americanum]|uniref:Acyltransferase 3 domain-containing protein n=1 Tax=Amblyomma americanum TaxID=6943 RepID=A0AAQ4DMY7_AMBAM
MDSATKSLKRQLLSVDLSTQCSLGIVKFVRGIRNLEPWAVRRGLLSFLVVFSVVSNTRMILQPAADDSTDSYSLRFLHGVRYLSLTWIVIGSGFLLAAFVCKQKRTSLCAVISLVVKRYIRTTVPVFFLIMCLYLLPLVTSGPDAIGYFTKVHNDFMWQWPLLLLQVQNYGFTMDARGPSLAHLWYLSLDFQFFLLCLPILILLKNRPKLAVATFLLLSVVGCSVAAWQVASHNMTPFLVALTESPLTFLATRSYYFFYPHYHAVCYFMGCVTFFFVRRYKERKVSEVSFSFTVLVWSYMLGYLLFVFCEAPTDRLGKLIFEPRLRKANNDRNNEALNANGPEEKLICAIATLGNSEISTASGKGKSIFNDFHYASSNLASCHL